MNTHSTSFALDSAVERHQPRLYHDVLIPDETRAIHEEVRRFADAHVAPEASEIGQQEESVSSFPRELFGKMAEAGLFRIPFASEVGGRSLQNPATATTVMIEELAYHSNSVAAILNVHCILAGHAREDAMPG